MHPIQVHPAKEDDRVTGVEKKKEGDGDKEDKDDDKKHKRDGREDDEEPATTKKEWRLLPNCSIFGVIEALVALAFCLLSVACILVAVVYINHCMTEGANFLCAWLIVYGVSVLSAMTSTVFWQDLKKKQSNASFAATGPYLLLVTVIMFSTFWLIIGNIVVWIWWGLGWSTKQPCYEQMLKFSMGIVVVFDFSWVLTALLYATHVAKAKDSADEDENVKEEEKEEEEDDKKDASSDNMMIAEQYFKSLFCPVNDQMTWQSCIGYSTLMLYFIMAIISLVIGSIYENRCPNTKLPLWLLVQAVTTIIIIGVKVFCRVSCRVMTNSTRNFVISFFPMTVFLIFQVAWIAIGNDWAFHVWRHEKLSQTSPSNATETTEHTEFVVCDQKLYIFFCCIIALFDIPVMVFILLSIAMTIVLIFYFASPCFPDNLCGKTDDGEDQEDPTSDGDEKGKVENGKVEKGKVKKGKAKKDGMNVNVNIG